MIIQVDAPEFLEICRAERAQLVDIREEEEVSLGVLPGAKVLPMSQAGSWVGDLDPSAPLALYCRTGNRVKQLASALEEHGFQKTYAAVGYGYAELSRLCSDAVGPRSRSLLFRQIFDPATSTLSYVFGDPKSKEVAIVDSVSEHFEVYENLIREGGFQLRYLFETHIHADHITANAQLLGSFPEAKVALSETAPLSVSFEKLKDGDVLRLGEVEVQVLSTPGHTSDDLCFLIDGHRLLTGDTLFVNSCGRTDFQNGSSERMHESLRRLASLPADVLVYPGHDYNGRRVSTIGEQRGLNPLLSLSKEEFVAELSSWKLNNPARIDEAVPANLRGGEQAEPA